MISELLTILVLTFEQVCVTTCAGEMAMSAHLEETVRFDLAFIISEPTLSFQACLFEKSG